MMFMSGFILLIFVTSQVLPSDGALSRSRRVVGGDRYAKGEYPFHVSLWYMGDNNVYTSNTPNLHHTCGGSLIGDQWVLTSAVCFDENFLTGLTNSSLWKIYLGMYAQTDAEDDAELYTFDQIFLSPEYNLTQRYGDVALLKLNKRVTLGNSVSTIGINEDGNCPAVGADLTVIGWGQTQSETYGLGSDYPHKATVQATDLDQCIKKYTGPDMEKYGFRLDEKIMCAGTPQGGKDGCYGDSGSPLVGQCGNQQVVVGISSYGYGCGVPGWPSVYTRVSSFKEWITSTINQNS